MVELPEEVPINLPASALMFVCPIVAASILTYRARGPGGVRALVGRALDYERIERKRWYIPILFLMPAIMVLSYGVMTVLERPLPDPEVPVLMIPVFLLAFFLPALCEEVGWQGYACDPLQARWGALGAGLLMGTVWGVWHAVPYLQAANSPSWAVWQVVTSVGLRVLIVWVYNNTGRSVFGAIVLHDSANASEFLFPNYGSAYDPFVTGVIMAVVVAIVVFLWGPGTLARYRYARRVLHIPGRGRRRPGGRLAAAPTSAPMAVPHSSRTTTEASGSNGLVLIASEKRYRIGPADVLEVVEPLGHEQGVDPVQVDGEVGPVGRRQDPEVGPAAELLGRVEDRPQELGERLVLEQGRVLEQRGAGSPAGSWRNALIAGRSRASVSTR